MSRVPSKFTTVDGGQKVRCGDCKKCQQYIVNDPVTSQLMTLVVSYCELDGMVRDPDVEKDCPHDAFEERSE